MNSAAWPWILTMWRSLVAQTFVLCEKTDRKERGLRLSGMDLPGGREEERMRKREGGEEGGMWGGEDEERQGVMGAEGCRGLRASLTARQAEKVLRHRAS